MGYAIVATALCVVGCIIVHLFVLRLLWLSARSRLDSLNGIRIAVMVLGCMLGHIIEIGIFALGMFFVASQSGEIRLVMEGLRHEHLDLWYYSAAFYTSLGDSRPPTEGMRLFAACEALTGLILITWTASFLFLLMQRSWTLDGKTNTDL